jgi:predicted nucleic acid-binding protein
MTMNAEGPVFLDTNVLIRYDILETPEHASVRQAVRALIAHNCTLWISRQVIREYCRVLTHPGFTHPLDMRRAVRRARQIVPYFQIADENETVTQNLFALLEQVPIGGKQVHDANIVATMQSVGVTQLLTLNTADFRRFEPGITLLGLDELVS